MKPSFICLYGASGSLVSFTRAPGFRPISKEEFVTTKLADIPQSVVPAFVIPDVISETQEKLLIPYTNKLFDRLDFVDSHVDALIHHYKEFYRSFRALDGVASTESREQEEIGEFLESTDDSFALDFIRSAGRTDARAELRKALSDCQRLAQSFVPRVPLQDRLHFLQLHTSGFIRAHADESRNSSAIVAGVTLGSARVMTLTHPQFLGAKVDMLLAPRSMYVIVGAARTEWEHSVDWEMDDDEHIERSKPQKLISETDFQSPVMFDGSHSGFYRGTRTALIFRGLSPMDLFAHRMKQRQVNQGASFDLFSDLRNRQK